MLNFTYTDVAGKSDGIKVLVYGEPGNGKTVLCSTAPKPLIISAERGLLSLRHKKIPVIVIENEQELLEALTYCQTAPEMANFDTICLDSITEIAEKVLSSAKAVAKDPRQAYGELMERMTHVIKQFRDIPGKSVVVIAKQSFVDVGMGVHKFLPTMPGSKLGQAIPYYFDEVFCLRIGQDNDGNKTRYLQTQPDFQYEAKDRSGALADMEPPDLTYIFNKILGE